MSIFDFIAEKIKPKPTIGTAGFSSLFDAIGNYFAPSPNGVRARDVIREIPGATANIGKEIAKGVARVGVSAGEAIPRLSSPALVAKEGPEYELPFVGKFNSYQTQAIKNVGEGSSPTLETLKTVGNVAVDEPLGVAFKPVFLAGTLLAKTLGKQTVKESVDLIAKSNSVDEIGKELKQLFKGTDEEIQTLAKEFQSIEDPKIISSRITEIQSSPANIVAQDAPKFKTAEEFVAAKEATPEAAAIPKEELAAVWEKANDITPATKERGLITSAKEADNIIPEVKVALDEKYSPISNKEILDQANKLIDNNIDEAFRIARSTRPPTALDNAVSMSLVQRLQKEALALKEINPTQSQKLIDDAVEIIENTSRKATTQGQAIQSLSMFSRLSPDGILAYTQKQISKANDLIPNEAKKIKLSPKQVSEFVKDAENLQAMADDEDKIVATAELLKKIDDLLPKSTLAKISSVQTMFQLLNPKTFGRNIIGNVGFATLENVSDVVGTVFDSALSVVTKTRTKSLPSFTAQAKGFSQGLREGIRDAMKGINTSGLGTQLDLPQTSTFKGAVGKAAEKLLNMTLRGPDRAFYQSAYDGALAQQMKAAKVSVPTEAMKEVAHFDGLYRTFQDENVTTRIFQGIKKALNANKEFGVGDFVLKYPKTPANLLNRGLAYSPAGFVSTVFELARPLITKGPFNQKRFVETTSRAIVGTAGLFGTGAVLHRLGIITGQRDENSDVDQAEKQIGLGQYKINISALKRFVMGGFDPDLAKIKKGDTLISYDWFQPAAIALSLGANFDAARGGSEGALSTLATSVASGTNTLAEQPLISGLTQPLKNTQNLSDAALKVLQGVPSSFVPTLLNQIKQLTDNTVRNTYDPDFIKYSLNLVQNRIPGLSEMLPPKYGTFGQKQEVYQDGGNNLFNVFFNPAFVSQYKPTPEAQMVLDIYQSTGDVKQVPNIVSKTQTINGESRKLTAKEITNMQRYVGTITREIFSTLAQSEQFTALSDDEKAKLLSTILSDIGSAGKVIFLGNKPKSLSSTAQGLVAAFIANNATRGKENETQDQK